jgi:hypothetical protein
MTDDRRKKWRETMSEERNERERGKDGWWFGWQVTVSVAL